MLAGQDRRRFTGQRRQIFHVVVEGRQRAIPSITQHLVKAALLGFAGKKGNSKRLRLHHLLRHLGQHRNAARHVKAADAHRETAGDEATPTSPISALPPSLRIIRMIRSGRTRLLVSS